MWDLILNPFVTLLTLLYSALNQDIVLAIVVLTILIRMLTYPLTHKQQQSMKKTQELQPELEKLKKKYENDREKLSQAQMELYRQHGINPLGGCLPLVIQFPILIGLYQAILFALAATPFQLVDLSDRLMLQGLDHLIPLQNVWLGMDLRMPPTPPNNPAYALALPLLVMVTTWLQSKMTMGNQPQQSGETKSQTAAMTQSMTTIMPIMFGAFALSFSVGISIYFIVSNVVGIFQYSSMGKSLLERIFPEKAEKEIRKTKPGIADRNIVDQNEKPGNGKPDSAEKPAEAKAESQSQPQISQSNRAKRKSKKRAKARR